MNLANPDRPEVYWELEETIAGLAHACRALEVPIVSGNVSLYNDSEGRSPIHPTPVVGMIGVFTLHHFAKVNLHPPATKLGAQIIGGLTFGIGFALIAYCPGTGAAALCGGGGQGDAAIVTTL